MELTLPLILGAGLIDGINPCAFAVLIFLASYLTRLNTTKKKVILTGITYIISVYLTYLLIGLSILQIAQEPTISNTIYLIAGFVAVITGLLNIKDYFYYGQGFTLRIPVSQKERINKWVKKGTIPSALILGIIVSLFELPCTGSVYFAILALLSQSTTHLTAVYYLMIYNLMFVLPLIIMFGSIIAGYSITKATAFKEEHKDVMKLASGILLLILGIWMLITVYS